MSTLNKDIITEIIKNAKAAGRGGKLDLREFQTELFRRQRARRIAGTAQALARMQVKKHRIRVKHPKIGDTSIIDTRTDDSGKRLYFELSNGQAVRADRTTIRTTKPAGKGWRRGKRRLPFKNGLIWSKVASEIERNANRKAAQ